MNYLFLEGSILILSYLKIRDVSSVSLVNKDLYEIANHNQVWWRFFRTLWREALLRQQDMQAQEMDHWDRLFPQLDQWPKTYTINWRDQFARMLPLSNLVPTELTWVSANTKMCHNLFNFASSPSHDRLDRFDDDEQKMYQELLEFKGCSLTELLGEENRYFWNLLEELECPQEIVQENPSLRNLGSQMRSWIHAVRHRESFCIHFTDAKNVCSYPCATTDSCHLGLVTISASSPEWCYRVTLEVGEIHRYVCEGPLQHQGGIEEIDFMLKSFREIEDQIFVAHQWTDLVSQRSDNHFERGGSRKRLWHLNHANPRGGKRFYDGYCDRGCTSGYMCHVWNMWVCGKGALNYHDFESDEVKEIGCGQVFGPADFQHNASCLYVCGHRPGHPFPPLCWVCSQKWVQDHGERPCKNCKSGKERRRQHRFTPLLGGMIGWKEVL